MENTPANTTSIAPELLGAPVFLPDPEPKEPTVGTPAPTVVPLTPEQLEEIKKMITDLGKSDDKKWYKSKTIWFNILTAYMEVIVLILNTPLFADKPTLMAILAIFHGAGNIFLRFLTTIPIQ